MARYTIGHAYRSSRDGVAFGPWEAGEKVELDAADAEWLERDSPGVLVAEPEAPARQAAAKADRQARGGRNRSA
jgi:hypothetical protein